MPLPQFVAEEDLRLETGIVSRSAKLAELRWRWTLDESNPGRVPVSEYARRVGLRQSTIRGYARGYALWRDAGGGVTLTEAIERARMGGETEAAARAVAESRGQSLGHVRQARRTEVRRVREVARDRAERRGTTVEEEVRTVAETITRVEAAGRTIRSERLERLGFRFVEMERLLDSAKRTLVKALDLAQEIDWGPEESEMLDSSVANVKALLGLIDVAFEGAADVDWDEELAKLTQAGDGV